jgi:hypothetical protein
MRAKISIQFRNRLAALLTSARSRSEHYTRIVKFDRFWPQRPDREVADSGRSMALSTLSRQPDFSGADGQRIKLTGSRRE